MFEANYHLMDPIIYLFKIANQLHAYYALCKPKETAWEKFCFICIIRIFIKMIRFCSQPTSCGGTSKVTVRKSTLM